jgi:hypothetical protein
LLIFLPVFFGAGLAMMDDGTEQVRPAVVNCDTGLGQALIAMFRSLDSELRFERSPPGSLIVVVFGGCAVHLYTSHRVSTDVDAEFVDVAIPSSVNLRDLLAALPEAFQEEGSGRVLELTYDLNFSACLGPLHEDYLERGVPLVSFGAESPLQVLIASPVDVAISKLGRGTDQDISDIYALLRTGFILASDFERLALQAIDCYVGNHEPPTSILRNILEDYLETPHGEPC